MEMPSVHKCSQLFGENEKLKAKVKKVSDRNKDLLRELNDVREKMKADELLKQSRVMKCESTQTEAERSRTGLPIRPVVRHAPSRSDDKQRADKLLEMHNSLMKRYEKEVKMNADHCDTIDKLNLRISELEKLLAMTKSRLSESEQERLRSNKRRRSSGRSQSPTPESDLKKERDELKSENQKLKKELSGLDKNFFDELEDLKFSLHQSAKLNQQYEKTLMALCTRFNVPFPHPT